MIEHDEMVCGLDIHGERPFCAACAWWFDTLGQNWREKMMEWRLEFDGACEPINPGGTMGWGWRIISPVGHVTSGHGGLSAAQFNTNNVAEWNGVLAGLRKLGEVGVQGSLLIRGDSKLVINQLTGRWKCKTDKLAVFRDEARKILEQSGLKWQAEWCPREQNEACDELSKRSMK